MRSAPLFSPPNDAGQTVPHQVTMPTGETVPVPDELADIVACGELCGSEPDDVADSLVAALFRRGLFVFPRARANTREAVNADIYSLALSQKHASERRQKAVQDLLFPVVQRDDGQGLRSLDVRDVLRQVANYVVGSDKADLLAVIERLGMAEDMLREVPKQPEVPS